MAEAPTRAKSQLGKRLRAIRRVRGISSKEAASALKTSDATLRRYETGHVLPNWGAVSTLMVRYEATPDEVAEVERLYEVAQDEPKPVRLPTGTQPAFRRLVNSEQTADRIRTLQIMPLPGLLQTAQYTAALVRAAHPPVDDLDSWTAGIVRTRTQRQQRLVGPSPLRVHALIDEAAIDRRVGGATVMITQLNHLVVLAGQSNVTLQVIPYSVGAYGTSSGGFTVVDYLNPSESSVYYENSVAGSWVDDPTDVKSRIEIFDRTAAMALPSTDTISLVQQKIAKLEEIND